MIQLKDLLRDTMALRPLPQSAQRLALLCTGEIDVEEIARVVSLDQGLAVRTLRAANGVASGSLHTIKTVRAAVMRLGPTMVATLAMGSSMQGRMQSALPHLGLPPGELWHHAIAASIAVEEMREYVSVEMPEECAAGALLHDIGKLVLERHVRRHLMLGMRRACLEAEDRGIEAEREWLTLDHAAIGAMVARHWELPELIAAGIAHHHDPSEADPGDARTVAHVIHLADLVAQLAADGFDRLYLDATELDSTLAYLGVRPRQIGPLSDSVAARTAEIVAAYT